MKKTPSLSAQELEELMVQYTSEVRKLTYLLQQSQENLDDVKKQYQKAAKEPKKAAAPVVTKKATTAKAEKPAKPAKAAKAVKAAKPAKAAKVAKPAKAGKKAAKAVKEVAKAAEKPLEIPAAPKKQRGRPRKEKTAGAPTASTAESAPKRGRGRPKKSEDAAPKVKAEAAPKAAPKVAKKAGRKPKASARVSLKGEEKKLKGYRLSEWDIFIINSIKDANRVLVNAEIMDKAKAKNKKEKVTMDDLTLHGKLNRSIHKLANKRRDLIKVDFPGKGYAYGLAEWADEKGKIRVEFHQNGKK